MQGQQNIKGEYVSKAQTSQLLVINTAGPNFYNVGRIVCWRNDIRGAICKMLKVAEVEYLDRGCGKVLQFFPP
jgi:hypothetical protein